MSYQQCARFWTTLQTLVASISGMDEAIEKRKMVLGTTIFYVQWRQFCELWTINRNDLDLWSVTLKLNMVSAVVKVRVRTKYHQAECSGSCPISQWWKIPKIQSCDLDLWPWNSLSFVRLSRYMFLENFVELSAAVHELSCVQRKTMQSGVTTRTVLVIIVCVSRY